MGFVVSIIVGLIILFLALKILTGILKTIGIVAAIVIAAAIYFAMGGVS